MDQIKISVIMPVYNTEKYLRTALDSVLEQTLPDLELICIDDGSRDGSSAILSQYAAKDRRIRLFAQKHHGQSSARNTGLAQARGEYIFFADSDDYLVSNALATAYQHASGDSLDILLFDAKVVFETGELAQSAKSFSQSIIRSRTYGMITSGEKMYVDMSEKYDYRCMLWMHLFKRSYLEQFGLNFYEGIVYEDNLFTISALLHAPKAKHISNILYFYRLHAGSCVNSPASFMKLNSASIVAAQELLLSTSPDISDSARKYIIRESKCHLSHCEKLRQEWHARMLLTGTIKRTTEPAACGTDQKYSPLKPTEVLYNNETTLKLRQFELKKWNQHPIVLCGTLDKVARAADFLLENGCEGSIYICYDEKYGENYHGIAIISTEELPRHRGDNLLLGSKVFYPKYMSFLPHMTLNDWFFINQLLTDPTERKNYEYTLYNFFKRRKDAFIIQGIELVLTQRCNLRCRHCANLMQYYTSPHDYQENEYLESFTNVLNAADGLACLRIIGGEPLLLQERIDKILELFGNSEKIFTIEIPTNGTLLLKEKTALLLSECLKATVLVSDYGQHSRQTASLIDQLKKYGISHLLYDQSTPWHDFGDLSHYSRSITETQNVYNNCSSKQVCTTLLGDKLFLCPMAAHGTTLGVMHYLEDEYLDLQDKSFLRERIFALYTRKKHINACEYCLGGTGNIIRGEQAERALPYQTIDESRDVM